MRSYKILSFSVVILLITVVFAGVVPAAAQTDTMQFRYNAQHTGDYSPVAGPVPSNGQLLWSCATLAGSSSPVVANGIGYVGSNVGYDDYLYAFNATTGALLWSNTTGGDSLSCPAVSNGVVYAFNATTGANLWNYTMADLMLDSPAVANGVVYVGGEGMGDNLGNVYALNATSGALLWSYTTGGDVGFSSPAVSNGVVYVGSYASWNAPSLVYALDANNGSLLWSRQTRSGVQSSPAVANGVVYVGSWDGNVYAFNATSGATLWVYPFGYPVIPSPAIFNGVLYLGEVAIGNASTSLTAAASPTVVAVNSYFAIAGKLGNPGIAGATITMQRSTNNATWNNVTTTTTSAAGMYQFSNNESIAGTYYYRTAYDGNASVR